MDGGLRREIQFDCFDVLDRYAVAVGEGDTETFVSLFAPAATWARPGRPELVGRDAIAGFMKSRPAGRRVVHINGTRQVDLEGPTSARAISYTTVYQHPGPADGPLPMSGPSYVVKYVDRFERINGSWLIARRDTTLVFKADFAADLPVSGE